MKRNLLILVALVGAFVLNSSFSEANAQLGVPVTGSAGNCSFVGTANISLGNDGQNVLATGMLSGFIYNNNGTPSDPNDDPAPVPVNETVNEAVSLNGTGCGWLSLDAINSFTVSSACGSIDLNFSNVSFTQRPGGRLNLITNSLCAIGRYYDNGQSTSTTALFSHVDNFMGAVNRR